MPRHHHTKEPDDTELVRFLLAGGHDLFRDPRGELWATLRSTSGERTYQVNKRNQGLQDALRKLFHQQFGHRIGKAALAGVIEALQSEAQKGPIRQIFCRVGSFDEGLVLDLGWDTGEVAVIGELSWQVVSRSPVAFYRPAGLRPLPEPVRTKRSLMDELGPVLAPMSRPNQVLAAAFLIGSINPRVPQVLLELVGPQGSAKTCFTKALRAVVDPTYVDTRTAPEAERDLFIAAQNSWLLTFDNLSAIRPRLSDALCAITSGGGFATRRLYSDEEEALFNVRRPVILNGIHEVVTRPDLRDRTLTIALPRIDSAQRITDGEFWQKFRAAHPSVLAALLDCGGAALLLEDTVTPGELPRVADWYRFVFAAAESGHAGFSAQEFQAVFSDNRKVSHEVAIDASPIGRLLLSLVADSGNRWQGTVSGLLAELNAQVERSRISAADWPRSPEALRRALGRIGPDLEATGLSMAFRRSKTRSRERIVELHLGGERR